MLAEREVTDLLRLLDDPVFLSPVPKRGELGRRRFVRSLEMRAVIPQHLSESHSVRPGAIRIGAALEQGQRICISEPVIESHLRAVKQQRITRVRPILGHRGIGRRCRGRGAAQVAILPDPGSNPNTSS
jgi:hypothetical protein